MVYKKIISTIAIILISGFLYPQNQKDSSLHSADLSYEKLTEEAANLHKMLWSRFQTRDGVEKLQAAVSFSLSFATTEEERAELLHYLWTAREMQPEGNDWDKEDSYWGATYALGWLGDRKAEMELLSQYQRELTEKSSNGVTFLPRGSSIGGLYIHMRGGIHYLSRILMYEDKALRTSAWTVLTLRDPSLKDKYKYDPELPPQKQMQLILRIRDENLDLLGRPMPMANKQESSMSNAPEDEPKWTPDLTEPKILKRVEPSYPEKLVGKLEVMVCRVFISEDGSVLDAKVLRSSTGDAKRESAMTKALKQWKFQPATSNDGKPVRVWYTITIKLEPQDHRDS